MSTNCRLDSPTAVIMPEGAGEPLEKPRGLGERGLPHSATVMEPGASTWYSPKRVQNIPPKMGSGSEAKRAVNLPMVPRTSMMHAPYCTTRRLPTCQGARGRARCRGRGRTG